VVAADGAGGESRAALGLRGEGVHDHVTHFSGVPPRGADGVPVAKSFESLGT